MNWTSRHNVLFVGTSILCSLWLGIELSIVGWSKYNELLSGSGGDYPVFPDGLTQFRIIAAYLILHILYLSWYLRCDCDWKSLSFATPLKLSAIFLLLAFIAFPLGNDIYFYLQFGSMNWHGVNPFVHSSGSFDSDLLPFIRWDQKSPYGPISQIFFSIAALGSFINIPLGVYIFKIICIFLHIFNGYLIWRIVNRKSYRSTATLAYLVHPLLLFDQVANAHNDVIINMILLSFLVAIKYRCYFRASLLLIGGFFSKTLPLIWMPLYCVFLLKKKKWGAIAASTVFFLMVAVLLERTILPTVGAWQALLNPIDASANSLHHILNYILERSPGISSLQASIVESRFKKLTILGFAGFYIWRAWKGYNYKIASPQKLLLDIAQVTLFLFLFAVAWIVPWYASVLVPIAILYPQDSLAPIIFSFCISSVFGYASFSPPLPSVICVGLPILIFIWGQMFPQRRKFC